MIIINDVKKSEIVFKNTFDLPIGTTFRGKIGPDSGIFLRMYSGVVLLKNPCIAWTDRTGRESFPTVANYEEVDLEVDVLDKK